MPVNKSPVFMSKLVIAGKKRVRLPNLYFDRQFMPSENKSVCQLLVTQPTPFGGTSFVCQVIIMISFDRESIPSMFDQVRHTFLQQYLHLGSCVVQLNHTDMILLLPCHCVRVPETGMTEIFKPLTRKHTVSQFSINYKCGVSIALSVFWSWKC